MPDYTPTLRGPVIGICIVLALASIYVVFLTALDGEGSKGSDYLLSLAFGFPVAWGVEIDRRSHPFHAPYEYAAFMLFFWPIMLPVYLFSTRRWRGLMIALAVFGASFFPTIAGLVYFYVR